MGSKLPTLLRRFGGSKTHPTVIYRSGVSIQMIRFINALLLILALVSALFLINIRNQTRDSFVELNSMQNELNEMHKEYERMQVQRVELTNTQRVRQAADKQGLEIPPVDRLKIIEKKGQ
ncbi:MAG: cell division protein FtsL [Neisseriaceae bacterium]|nr:cell division protein FtsL [Neisseriaceae bacterium]MBR5675427.1 cell division protein FtsL [Neisseriaceae bacterium]